MKKREFLGLIHRGDCQGMVAPALGNDVTEQELRDYIFPSQEGVVCMRCGAGVVEVDTEAEYIWT